MTMDRIVALGTLCPQLGYLTFSDQRPTGRPRCEVAERIVPGGLRNRTGRNLDPCRSRSARCLRPRHRD